MRKFLEYHLPHSVSWLWVTVPGILFAGMAAMLLWMGRQDYKAPKRPAQDIFYDIAITPTQDFPVEWGARREPAAPPLSIDMSYADLGLWLDRRPVPQMRSTNPPALRFFTVLPDPGALSVRMLGDWCPSGLRAKDCELALLQITLHRDPVTDGHGDNGERVRGEQRAGYREHVRYAAFWTRTLRQTGRVEFVGWDCPGEVAEGPVTTDVLRPVLERNRCFDPGDAARRAPRPAGYERSWVLFDCPGRAACRIRFPYRGRAVEVQPVATPIHEPSVEINRRLFLSAWEFVNRLRADALHPPSAEARLARASAARANCEAVHGLLRQDGARDGSLERHLRWHCGYALLQAVRAEEALPMAAVTSIDETRRIGGNGLAGIVERRH